MSTKTAARPRQTTMAGAMVMLAATFVVLSVADTVSRLRSIETREMIEKFLADPPGNGLGLSFETMIQLLHAIAVVAALSSVAAVALGWQVLQRSRQARVALSVLAVPIFVTGLVAGGFMSSLVAVATAMLWLSPSREWFAGLPIPEPVKVGRSRRDVDVQTLSGQAAPGQLRPPLATNASAAGWSAAPADQTDRPAPVTVAVVLTVVFAGLVLVMTLVSLALLAAQPDLVLDEVRRQNPDLADQGVSDALLVNTAYVTGGLAVAWSALAVVLAVFLARRRVWAAQGLLICAAVTALFGVIATLASPVALIPAVAAIATVSCLRRPEVRAWLTAPR
ncbi:hypothetical protein [Nocardioides sp.]|uniref:hypothetical protein n=1 Tax=Nocardioides sp. TaxID=35761 RepID=UPI00286DE8DE|nr:hypothetical protein [Nocardioides sp.]